MSKSWIQVLMVAVLLAGCSDDSKPPVDSGTDRSVVDGPSSGLPDGYGPLWPCENVGKSCNAHDPCALNPICSQDKRCIPSGLQDCSDGLACTQDVCKGMGLCENIPSTDGCALPVKVGETTEMRCFDKDDTHPNDPCLVCDPDIDPKKWSPANGGSCDDGNNCSKDDYCQQGTCKGVYYGDQCADEYGCTEDLCDGKGGCIGNQLKSDWCLINGACHKDQGPHPAGSCFICDVKSSQSQWTPITNTCLIDNKCYNASAQHPTGDCAICDPAVSASVWTTTGTGCLIGNTCYKPGVKDSINCNECDPTKSKTAWTPLSGLCTIDGKCYQQGAAHTGGCAECDTAASATSWTVKGSYCLVSNVCKNPGDKDTTGCNECAPTKDKYNWSTVANTCFINGKCYTTGTKNPSATCAECDPALSPTSWSVKGTGDCYIAEKCYTTGQANVGACATCDPAKSKYAWTPGAGKCLITDKCYNDGDKHTSGCLQCSASVTPTAWSPSGMSNVTNEGFENGSAAGWIISNTDSKVGWVVSTKRPSGGSYSLYYGDPATGNFSSGSTNSGTASMPAVTLTAGKTAGLAFMLYMDTESGTTYDKLKVYAGSTVVWDKNVTTTVTMKTWMPISVNLTAYAGQTITIKFEFNTVDSVANSTEGVYIDDIAIYDNC